MVNKNTKTLDRINTVW